MMRECPRYMSIRVVAKAFLQNQVRYIVAALLAAGLGQMSPEDVAALLEPPYSKERKAPPPVPPHGLYLARVEYPEEAFVEGASNQR